MTEHIDQVKYRILMLFIGGGNSVIFAFSIVNLVSGHYVGAAITLLVSLFIFFSYIFFAKRRSLKASGRLVVYGFTGLCIYLYCSGGFYNTGYLWIFMLPMVSFFLEGNKKGIHTLGLFLIASIGISVLHFLGIHNLPYSDVHIAIFHAAFIVNAALMNLIHRILAAAELDLFEKMREVSALNSQLEYYAFFDTLTGIYNRRQIIANLVTEIERYKRSKHEFCIILFDIDHFKAVNDTYGHQFGDYVLKALVNGLNDNILRRSDSIGRYGGEEFLVIMPETRLEGALIAAERLRQYCMDFTFYNTEYEKPVPVTISIGLAEYQGDNSLDTLLRKADVALYEAKHRGRNTVKTWHPKLDSGKSH